MDPQPHAPSSPSTRTDDPRDRKATLFCPDCGHASPVDGDWVVRTVGRQRRIRCPDCRAVIDDRRVRERHPAPADRLDASVRWCVDTFDRYLTAWTALVTGDRNADY